MPLQAQLERVLQAHSLDCGLILNAHGEVVIRAGDFGRHPPEGLLSTLLGPAGSPSITYELVSPSETIRPVLLEAKPEFALLERTGPLLVVVLGCHRAGALQHLAFAAAVSRTISVLFSN